MSYVGHVVEYNQRVGFLFFTHHATSLAGAQTLCLFLKMLAPRLFSYTDIVFINNTAIFVLRVVFTSTICY